MLAATELYPEIPTVLHLDHGNSVETCKTPSTWASPA
jgi:fructose-bisphosphate aldolase class II